MANYEFDSLRNVLTTRALQTAVAVGMGDVIKLPNTPFVEPNERNPPVSSPWLNFWFKIGATGQAELGGPAALEVTVGLLQFDIFVPEQTGDGAAYLVANKIKKQINRKQWLVPPNAYVSLQAAGIVMDLPSAKSGWYRACVDATFMFHHRDPDADPLQDFS